MHQFVLLYGVAYCNALFVPTFFSVWFDSNSTVIDKKRNTFSSENRGF